MRIRLALTLDMRREPKPEPDQRETDLSATTERAELGRPPIGFTAPGLEPFTWEDHATTTQPTKEKS